jgi:hypothetical protein
MPYGTVNADLMTTSDGVSSSGLYGFKNRLINSAMVIDQRNAGASVTPTDGAYTLDRFIYNATQSSKVTIQQNAGSVTPPAGFTNYLGVTSSSAYSIGSGDFFTIGQRIEGFNTADLNWGTASASTVTLSFWVRSSLTGTFGGAVTNSALSRSYPFTYTISSANTWEQKSVTIAGDTTGTWIGATNGVGLRLYIGLGVGSTYAGTAGAWTGTSNILGATGATSVVGTNGATFYITGVQLEKGSTATSFDYRPYGTELALCQRYFCSSFSIGTAPAQNAGGGMIGKGANGATAEPILCWQFPVSMRAAPTVTTYNPSAANNQWSAGTTPRVVTSSTSFASIDNTGNPVTAGTQSYINASASIEL